MATIETGTSANQAFVSRPTREGHMHPVFILRDHPPITIRGNTYRSRLPNPPKTFEPKTRDACQMRFSVRVHYELRTTRRLLRQSRGTFRAAAGAKKDVEATEQRREWIVGHADTPLFGAGSRDRQQALFAMTPTTVRRPSCRSRGHSRFLRSTRENGARRPNH